MDIRPDHQQYINKDDKWTGWLRKVIIILLVLIMLILIWIFLPQNYQSNSFQEIPVNFHSVDEGNYQADPTRYWNPVVNLSILKDIIAELEPESENVEERVDQVFVTLSAPVPTAQPQPIDPGFTQTLIPIYITPTQRSTSALISLTATISLTSSQTQTGTIVTPTQTPSPILSTTPLLTITITTTPMVTLTPDKTKKHTATNPPTHTSTPFPTYTSTYTKTPVSTYTPTNTTIPTSTTMPNPTRTKKYTPPANNTPKPTHTSTPTPAPATTNNSDGFTELKSRMISLEYLRSIVDLILLKVNLFSTTQP
ncbi:MAG: hypothetical protein AAGU17_03000 [Anaerolineaceae bacterium]|jgi:hypothetical protein